MSQVFKSGNVLGQDKVRVHRGGNRIDGVSKDNELFFNDLPVPKRSKIDLSFDRKLSFEMGQLVPILAQECVPGDTFHIAQGHRLMLAPLLAPLYQRIDYRTWYFFVPSRLVDDGFKDFITQKNPNYVLPYLTGATIAQTSMERGNNSLFDYFDLPVQQANMDKNVRPLCAHVFRMYNLIYNEYFRDEFKQTEVEITKEGGLCETAEMLTFTTKNIGWEKDYFTTCQTTPQLGADVSLPIGVSADGNFNMITKVGNPEVGDLFVNDNGSGIDTFRLSKGTESSVRVSSYNSGLKTTGTINDLRIANHLQELRDKLKIAGARYNEAILAEFGVVVPDYRIQRPEYIGGYAQPVDIGRVMQTTPTTGEGATPLGDYAGSATGSGHMDYIHYQCHEHGYIIGISCVVPRTSYDQGIPRHFIKDNIFDYYHPDLATLGDEQVYNDELFVSDNSSDNNVDNSRFGYQQRYASYKYAMDRINGDFRDSLAFWHMSRDFESLPALNGAFIESDPTTRVFAVPSADNHLYAEIYQQIDAVRPMPIAVQPNLTNVE